MTNPVSTSAQCARGSRVRSRPEERRSSPIDGPGVPSGRREDEWWHGLPKRASGLCCCSAWTGTEADMEHLKKQTLFKRCAIYRLRMGLTHMFLRP